MWANLDNILKNYYMLELYAMHILCMLRRSLNDFFHRFKIFYL